jgi:hypothetical protein
MAPPIAEVDSVAVLIQNEGVEKTIAIEIAERDRTAGYWDYLLAGLSKC